MVVRDGEVFGHVVQLQLRAEEIQSQRQELGLIRQRMIKLTGDGKTAGASDSLQRQVLSSLQSNKCQWTLPLACAVAISNSRTFLANFVVLCRSCTCHVMY
jgi:hypothetical protein